MIIYHPIVRDRTTHTIVTPGAEFPTSEFLGADGKPIQFVVKFLYGKAEVSENVGRYLIDKGLAQESAILMVA